jgi:hypothetical protein
MYNFIVRNKNAMLYFLSASLGTIAGIVLLETDKLAEMSKYISKTSMHFCLKGIDSVLHGIVGCVRFSLSPNNFKFIYFMVLYLLFGIWKKNIICDEAYGSVVRVPNVFSGFNKYLYDTVFLGGFSSSDLFVYCNGKDKVRVVARSHRFASHFDSLNSNHDDWLVAGPEMNSFRCVSKG